MLFNIAIPSLGRAKLLLEQTLSTLIFHNVPSNIVTIFVVEEEYELYRNLVPEEYAIIIGKKGLVNQRQFITDYYNENDKIICLDDDIKLVDLSLSTFKTLMDFFQYAFETSIEKNSYIWSVYPVYNSFFRKDKKDYDTCLNMCIGAFYGIINRKSCDDINLKITLTDNKEDVERSILYFKNDGIVLRFNKIGFKTQYYGNDGGGMGTLKQRLENIVTSTKALEKEYPTYGKIKIRKNGIYEFVLNKIKCFNPIDDKKVKQLTSIPEEEFNTLTEMLNNATFDNKVGKSNRRGFDKHKSLTFGLTKARFKGTVGLSRHTLKYPKIFEEVNRIGKLCCPFEYNAIHINKNVVCPPHIDSANNGVSALISFGDYEGCKIMIEDFEYNAKLTPTIFNGSCLVHSNTPLISGTKYSLVFYNI